MQTKTGEINLEEAIESSLLGHGYLSGLSSNFNRQYAIDELYFWEFLESTQKVELDKIKHKKDYKKLILSRLDKNIKTKGIVDTLKKPLRIDNASLKLFFSVPTSISSQQEKLGYEKSIFSVTRQVYYSNLNNNSIDMVLFINGIAIATMELKNEWTNQTAKYNAVRQYKKDRDPKEPLLNFGRCVVHFAVDTNEVYMTTKLDGENTIFLPFNKGNNHGAGNPTNPYGHRSAYLWEDILKKENITNIISKYVLMNEKKKFKDQTLYFPRYHQFDAVRKLLADCGENGAGKSYLIQHSAGSGKSNSITWLVYQLIDLMNEDDSSTFDSVIIVTDRRLLDSQLGKNVKKFMSQKGVVATANSSNELRENMENGRRIITTTIQKFPFIVDGISDMSEKNFAIIIDEAHSSQSGTAAGKMNQALGGTIDENLDIQDKIIEIIKARKVKDNVSYFAFTATPKNTTLERFGTKQADGSFVPFHLYSMKQAIEEGFILDVLSNYSTYKSYYSLEKSIADNPEFSKKRAQTKLKKYVENEVHTIQAKASIMLNHFNENIYAKRRLKGQAKAMVVTQNIEQAINYYFCLKNELEKMNNPFKILIAFSGEKEVNGIKYTESDLNGVSESKTRDLFEEDEYRILVVANKYLTGFDQPKLSAMYIDKKLSGVLCVQALSRLNRSAPKLGKKAEDLFVLDFYNTTDEIKESFDPYYTATSLECETDINVLHDIKELIDYEGVYTEEDVLEFSNMYFNGADAQQLSPILDKCADNFNIYLNLDDEEKINFKVRCKQFVKIYGQLAALIPFEDVEWESLYWFLKYLIPKLKVKTSEDELLGELIESIDLSSYGLERSKIGISISLDDIDSDMAPNSSNPHQAHMDEEKETLEAIIQTFNDKWFSNWDATEESKKAIFISLIETIKHNENYEESYKNNNDFQNAQLAFEEMLKTAIVENRDKMKEEQVKMTALNKEFYKLFVQDPEFKQSLVKELMRIVD